MRDQMAERIRELGAVPDVEVILDDSWSTDCITPEAASCAPLGLHLLPLASPVGRSSSSCRARRSSARTAGRRKRASRHLRPYAVPVGALLRELPPAVRAVQDDLSRLSDRWRLKDCR